MPGVTGVTEDVESVTDCVTDDVTDGVTGCVAEETLTTLLAVLPSLLNEYVVPPSFYG